ncbi:MAG: hypothetical protein OXF79_22430 [Chloroflexi bacterium]|nr:hypothetical protein [Chloroflexota bacterium]
MNQPITMMRPTRILAFCPGHVCNGAHPGAGPNYDAGEPDPLPEAPGYTLTEVTERQAWELEQAADALARAAERHEVDLRIAEGPVYSSMGLPNVVYQGNRSAAFERGKSRVVRLARDACALRRRFCPGRHGEDDLRRHLREVKRAGGHGLEAAAQAIATILRETAREIRYEVGCNACSDEYGPPTPHNPLDGVHTALGMVRVSSRQIAEFDVDRWYEDD